MTTVGVLPARYRPESARPSVSAQAINCREAHQRSLVWASVIILGLGEEDPNHTLWRCIGCRVERRSGAAVLRAHAASHWPAARNTAAKQEGV